MNTLLDQISNNFLLNTIYDIVKFTLSYLLARGLVDGVYMRWKWGGWQVLVRHGDKLLSVRNLSPAKAKVILTDANDLSVYIKGMVSPHAWLNIDICSDLAKDSGLFHINKAEKKLSVDIAKNPPQQKKTNP